MLHSKFTLENILLKLVIVVDELKNFTIRQLLSYISIKILKLCLESEIKENFFECDTLSIL